MHGHCLHSPAPARSVLANLPRNRRHGKRANSGILEAGANPSDAAPGNLPGAGGLAVAMYAIHSG